MAKRNRKSQKRRHNQRKRGTRRRIRGGDTTYEVSQNSYLIQPTKIGDEAYSILLITTSKQRDGMVSQLIPYKFSITEKNGINEWLQGDATTGYNGIINPTIRKTEFGALDELLMKLNGKLEDSITKPTIIRNNKGKTLVNVEKIKKETPQTDSQTEETPQTDSQTEETSLLPGKKASLLSRLLGK
jgi:hypothetical protein